MRDIDDLIMLSDQEKPVAAPRDIALHPADSRNINRKTVRRATAEHVGHADAAVALQMRFDGARRGVDFDRARRKPVN